MAIAFSGFISFLGVASADPNPPQYHSLSADVKSAIDRVIEEGEATIKQSKLPIELLNSGKLIMDGEEFRVSFNSKHERPYIISPIKLDGGDATIGKTIPLDELDGVVRETFEQALKKETLKLGMEIPDALLDVDLFEYHDGVYELNREIHGDIVTTISRDR